MFADLNAKILLAAAAGLAIGAAGGFGIAALTDSGDGEQQESTTEPDGATTDTPADGSESTTGGGRDGTAVAVDAAAAATGTVFDDRNGNGTQDDDEPGIVGVSVVLTHEETGTVTELGTDDEGNWRFGASPVVNHRVRIDESTLPFGAQLTTGSEEYHLNVRSGSTSPNVDFGYQEVEPAGASGVVFDDRNGNGRRDEGEPGIVGVTITATHDETGATTTITTLADGVYAFEATTIDHDVRVDESSLPFQARLTTGSEGYHLDVPPASSASDADFGYQAVQPAGASGIGFGSGIGSDGSGLTDVTVTANRDETRAVTTITTDADGFGDTGIERPLRLDAATIPLTARLTTSRNESDLAVPTGFAAPGVTPRYRQELAQVLGVVFDDRNGNGEQDEGEPGLPDVVVVAIEEDTGAPLTTTTGADGTYTIEADVINHRVRIDESSLPFSGQLTTGRLEYDLNVPPGFFAPNVNFGYQEVEPAAVYGTVFDDRNGNGTQDDGEPGLSGITITVTHDETGAITTITTDADGEYAFEATTIDHRLRVDETTLPFPGQLTTGRLEYNLNVPPGFFAPNVNFGYQEVEPAAVYGTVFDDRNGNGTQDDGEPGLSGITITVTHDETGAITTITTDADGEYAFEATPINHRLRVDETTLPFPGQLTTDRHEYNLNVPPGFFAPNVNFGYQEVEPSAASGIVFDDRNGNGVQDDGEPGLTDVALVVTEQTSGDTMTVTTDADGTWRHETQATRFAVTVDRTTLPFPAELTTGRDEYRLNIPNGFFAPNVNFGYQEVEPSVASGTVFDDRNGNGQIDDGEPGLADVALVVTEQATGDTFTITADADGTWRHESQATRFTVTVDEETLPFPARLTTGRDEYRLNIPNGFIAPNVNFGYQRLDPAEDSSASGSGGGGEPDAPNDADGGTNPFEDPDEDFDSFPDPVPEEDPQPTQVPLAGPWLARNYEGALDCGGFSLAIPSSVPEFGALEVLDGGATLIGVPVDGESSPVTMTADPSIQGRYVGSVTVSAEGRSITIVFSWQVVNERYIVGILESSFSAEGVTCNVYRSYDLTFAG